jgi:hypothetical protein
MLFLLLPDQNQKTGKMVIFSILIIVIACPADNSVVNQATGESVGGYGVPGSQDAVKKKF